jgi:hypothetical protein
MKATRHRVYCLNLPVWPWSRARLAARNPLPETQALLVSKNGNCITLIHPQTGHKQCSDGHLLRSSTPQQDGHLYLCSALSEVVARSKDKCILPGPEQVGPIAVHDHRTMPFLRYQNTSNPSSKTDLPNGQAKPRQETVRVHYSSERIGASAFAILQESLRRPLINLPTSESRCENRKSQASARKW